jgi:hypothetical protein
VLEIIFQVITGCSQVEDGVESIKVCLKGWQLHKVIGFGMFESIKYIYQC